MEKLNFCYVIDDNEGQCRMMGNGIRSINKCFSKYNCMIYVISLEEKGSEAYNRIVDTVKENSKEIPYEILFFDKRIAEILPMPIRSTNCDYLGYNALSRFFISYIVPCDTMYYVDADLVFLKDIYKKLIRLCDDKILMRMWRQHHFKELHETDHFNSGFMFINNKLWKKKKTIFKEIVNYFHENYLNIKQMDQDCYTWLASEKYKNICSCENDIAINNHHIEEGVEVFHGYGKDKNLYYWKELEKWEQRGY